MSYPFYQWEQLQRLQQLHKESNNERTANSGTRTTSGNQSRISPTVPRFSEFSLPPDSVRMRHPNLISSTDTFALVEEMRNMFQSGMISNPMKGTPNRGPPPLYNSIRTNMSSSAHPRGPPPLMNASMRQPPPAHSHTTPPLVRKPPPAHSQQLVNQPSTHIAGLPRDQIRSEVQDRLSAGNTIRVTNPFETDLDILRTRPLQHFQSGIPVSNTERWNGPSQMPQYSNFPMPVVGHSPMFPQSFPLPGLLHQSSNESQSPYIPPRIPLPHDNPFREFNISPQGSSVNQSPPVSSVYTTTQNEVVNADPSDKAVMGKWYKPPLENDEESEKETLPIKKEIHSVPQEKERIHRPSKQVTHTSLENVVNKLAKRNEVASPTRSSTSNFPILTETLSQDLVSISTQRNQEVISPVIQTSKSISVPTEQNPLNLNSNSSLENSCNVTENLDTTGTVSQQLTYMDGIMSKSLEKSNIDNNPSDIGLCILNTFSLAPDSSSTNQEETSHSASSVAKKGKKKSLSPKKVPPLKIKLPFRKSPKKKTISGQRKSSLSPLKSTYFKKSKADIEIRKPKIFSESFTSPSVSDDVDNSNLGGKGLKSPNKDGKSLGEVVEKVKNHRKRRRSAVLLEPSETLLLNSENMNSEVEVQKPRKKKGRNKKSVEVPIITENNALERFSINEQETKEVQPLQENQQSSEYVDNIQMEDIPTLSDKELVCRIGDSDCTSQLSNQSTDIMDTSELSNISKEERNRELIEKNWVQIEAKLKLVEKNLKNKSPVKKLTSSTESSPTSKTVEKTVANSKGANKSLEKGNVSVSSKISGKQSQKREKDKDKLSTENKRTLSRQSLKIDQNNKKSESTKETNRSPNMPKKNKNNRNKTPDVEKKNVPFEQSSRDVKDTQDNDECNEVSKTMVREKAGKCTTDKGEHFKTPKPAKRRSDDTLNVTRKSGNKSFEEKPRKKRRLEGKRDTVSGETNTSTEESTFISKSPGSSGKLSPTSASTERLLQRNSDEAQLISSITYPSFFVTFHGKRVLCLNSALGKLLLMREILRRNFKELIKNISGSGDMQKQYKTVYLAKERDLKICYKEIPDEHRKLAVKYLTTEKLLSHSAPAHLGVITLNDALRLYHYMNGLKSCSDRCIEIWSPSLDSDNASANDNDQDKGKMEPQGLKSTYENDQNDSQMEQLGGNIQSNTSTITDTVNDGYESDVTIPYVDESEKNESTSSTENQNHAEHEENIKNEDDTDSKLVLRGGVAEGYSSYFRYIVVEGEKFYPYEDLVLKFGKVALTQALQSRLPEKFRAYKCTEIESDFINKLEDSLPALSVEATLLEEALFKKVASTLEFFRSNTVVDLTENDDEDCVVVADGQTKTCATISQMDLTDDEADTGVIEIHLDSEEEMLPDNVNESSIDNKTCDEEEKNNHLDRKSTGQETSNIIDEIKNYKNMSFLEKIDNEVKNEQSRDSDKKLFAEETKCNENKNIHIAAEAGYNHCESKNNNRKTNIKDTKCNQDENSDLREKDCSDESKNIDQINYQNGRSYGERINIVESKLKSKENMVYENVTNSVEVKHAKSKHTENKQNEQPTHPDENLLQPKEILHVRAPCDSTTDIGLLGEMSHQISKTFEENNNNGNSELPTSVMEMQNNNVTAQLNSMLTDLQNGFNCSSGLESSEEQDINQILEIQKALNSLSSDLPVDSSSTVTDDESDSLKQTLKTCMESFKDSRKDMIQNFVNIWETGVVYQAKCSALKQQLNSFKTGTDQVLNSCEKYEGMLSKLMKGLSDLQK